MFKALRSFLEKTPRPVSTQDELRPCWFCKACSGAALFEAVEMYRYAVTPAFSGPGLNQLIAEVPKCRACARLHNRSMTVGFCAAVCLVLLFLTSSLSGGDLDPFGAILVGLIGGAIVALLYDSIFTRLKGSKPKKYAKKYPAIIALRNEGWKFGTSPPGTHAVKRR